MIASKLLFVSTSFSFAEGCKIDFRTAAYFSPYGSLIARRCNIPPPPIIILKPGASDPPRSRPADHWRAPFCLTWNDGQTVCSRAKVSEEPKCTPKSSDATTGKHDVVCAEADTDSVLRICQRAETSTIVFSEGQQPLGTFCQEEWTLNYDVDSRPLGWHRTSSGECNYAAASRRKRTKIMEVRKDTKCHDSYREIKSDGVIILYKSPK